MHCILQFIAFFIVFLFSLLYFVFESFFLFICLFVVVVVVVVVVIGFSYPWYYCIKCFWIYFKNECKRHVLDICNYLFLENQNVRTYTNDILNGGECLYMEKHFYLIFFLFLFSVRSSTWF